MTVRTKIIAVLALSLMIAGSAALIVNIVAFEQAPFPSWHDYNTALLEQLQVSREGAMRAITDNPDILFGTAGDTESWNGVTIDEASRAVQEQAIQRAVERSRLLTALSVVAVMLGALAAGGLVARRILRPIRHMTERARAATGATPGERLALTGPNDEIKELADTLDEMMDRISRSYGVQRLFAAQVAHELRTPLSTVCSEVDMLRADTDDPTIASRLEIVADATSRCDRLVGQLLILSRTETGDLERGDVAFDDLVGDVLGRTVHAPEWRRLRLDFDLQPATVRGDRALLDAMVRNLIENAGRHNVPDGWVRVSVRPDDQGTSTVLLVENSAASVSSDALQQARQGRTGLTIVGAVADAHGATMRWDCVTDRVLIRVTLPAGSRGHTVADGRPAAEESSALGVGS